MSTRSQIGLYDPQKGTLEYIFCHWDGYLKCVGQRLLGFYDTEQKVRDLLSHGDLSSLQNSPEISYFTGEPSQKVKVSSVEEAALTMMEGDIEFVYVFDVDSRKWVYASYNDVHGDSITVKPIPKDTSSFVWGECVTRKDAENDVLDILAEVNGKFVIPDNSSLFLHLDGKYINVKSIDMKKRSKEVTLHYEPRKTARMSDMTGFEVCELARQMSIHFDDVVKSERRNRFNHSRRNESFQSISSPDEVIARPDIARALCDLIDCDSRPENLLGNWSTFVKGDLASFPVWCYTDDLTGKVTFGISKLKDYITEMDDDAIDDAIDMNDIDDSFTRSGVERIAEEVVEGYLYDADGLSYEGTFTSPDGLELDIPCEKRELLALLERADAYYADVYSQMVEDLTNGICKRLGIGAWQDDRDVIDSLADERRNIRNRRNTRKENVHRISRNRYRK